MRHFAVATIVSLVVACEPGLAARKPLDQQPLGTGVLGGPSATLPTSAPASGSSTSSSSSSSSSDPGGQIPSDAPSGSSGSSGGAPSTVGDLCPPKGQKADLSRLASKSGCKTTVKSRSKHLADLRSNEQLLASMQANAPEREELVFRLAQGYAVLECSLASACAKARDANATPDEIPLSEAKKKTEDYCSTMKSDFPKSKRHCP